MTVGAADLANLPTVRGPDRHHIAPSSASATKAKLSVSIAAVTIRCTSVMGTSSGRCIWARLVLGPREMQRIWIDTFVGMAVSNFVAIAIMMSAAATLHAQGKTEVGPAADAAEALRPIAGDFAFALFSLGIIGTGLLSLPVLAGSSAYAFGESQNWKCGPENKPWEAVGFYGVIAGRRRHVDAEWGA